MPSSDERRAQYDLAWFGDAIGDPSRAAMLLELLGGTARPASELARAAEVSASTASAHLRRLERAGLVVVRAQGRHRYYALAGEPIASALESIGRYTSHRVRGTPNSARPEAAARTCYSHLAGRLAIAWWRHAKVQGWVRWSDVGVELLPCGQEELARHGLALSAGAPSMGRPCLDWTERVPHVAGPLGVGMCEALLRARWVARAPEGRSLRVTPRGRSGFRSLGLNWTE